MSKSGRNKGRNPLPPKATKPTVEQSGASSLEPPEQTFTAMEAHYNSPYPVPAVVDAFERNCPGSTDRMLAIVEAEVSHVHKLKEKDLDAAIEARKQEQRNEFSLEARSQMIAGSVVLVSIIAFVILATNGLPWLGLGVFGVCIAGIIGIAFFGKQQTIKISKDGIEAGPDEADSQQPANKP